MAGALAGLRVLDFSWGMAGAVASMLLADYGADVIKIEPPDGDPFWEQPAYLQWQRGKRSVRLDLKSEAGREAAQRLADGADILIESFRPGVAERLGIGYETLAALNPRLVYCSITGFGRRGPYANLPGYDGLVTAKAGRMMNFAGQLQREGPVYAAVPVASYGASQTALQGILAALWVRERTGRGQRVDATLLMGITPYDLASFISVQLVQRDPETFPPPSPNMWGAFAGPYMVGQTKDGRWIQFANAAPHLFMTFVRLLDMEHIYSDPKFAAAPALPLDQLLELRDLFLQRVREKRLDEWMTLFLAEPNIAAEPFRTTQEGMDHPQVLHNGHVITLHDPRVGPVRQIGPAVRMSATPAVIEAPAPHSGQHTAAVLADPSGAWGATVTAGAATAAAPAPPPAATGALLPPLDGVLVLDFASWYAGPFAPSLLADLGARVIKIEPLEGDLFRHSGAGALQGTTGVKTSQGKESLAVDLKTPEGQAIVHKLVAQADLVIHNFRPGAPARLGIDYETMRRINPRIVYLYGGAYGVDGPSSHRPAFHPIAGAIAGGALYQAGQGTPPPPGTPLSFEEVKEVSRQLGRSNEANPDPNSAMIAATAMMLGLIARQRTGQGQEMLTTMVASNGYANSDDFIQYAGKPERTPPDRGGYGLSALYRLYRAAPGWVFLAAPRQREFERLCAALGKPEWAQDARFATPAARRQNDAALAGLLAGAFAGRDAGAWEAALTAQDVGCVRADHATFQQFCTTDPSMREQGMMVEVEHPRWGRHLRHGPTVTFSEAAARMAPGCEIGEHTRALLAELGYSAGEIAALKARNVVTWTEPQRVAAGAR